jgi:hypothetical protein
VASAPLGYLTLPCEGGHVPKKKSLSVCSNILWHLGVLPVLSISLPKKLSGSGNQYFSECVVNLYLFGALFSVYRLHSIRTYFLPL